MFGVKKVLIVLGVAFIAAIASFALNPKERHCCTGCGMPLIKTTIDPADVSRKVTSTRSDTFGVYWCPICGDYFAW